MIERFAKQPILRLAQQFSVVAVTGPRQSGKSTLVKETFPNKRYVTFDDKSVRELAASNPRDFIKAFKDGVIIDEAQKVPELFDALKLIVDSEKYDPGKYILTGSSQFKLKKKIKESLSGRIGIVNLLPLSIAELSASDILSDEAYDYAFNGFYPPFYDDTKHFDREDWFENYIDTYIERDVADEIRVSNLSQFKKFIQFCAIYSGQMLNMESISREIGVSANTIKSWLSILENSFIVHLLEPDTNNLGRSIVKTPKLYFVDVGLLCYLLRIESKEELLLSRYKGAVVETMAVAELLKSRFNKGRKAELTFFRDTNGFEVDVIADWHKTYALEVKSDAETEKKQSANVRKYIELRDADIKGYVYYLGDITCDINNIKYVSWKEWGDK
ncbi:MAG: ATP-binding protein [Clostridiales bacterium]|nr:ATP-binding protein [Clostridiales bacterium]